jgi:hypothetical protein
MTPQLLKQELVNLQDEALRRYSDYVFLSLNNQLGVLDDSIGGSNQI